MSRNRRKPMERGNGSGMRAITGLLMIALCVATAINSVRINELKEAIAALQKENEAHRVFAVTVLADTEETERDLPAGNKSEPARQKLKRTQQRIRKHLETYPAPLHADGARATSPPERN